MSLEDLSTEARDELALLAKQLSENPETRKDFLRQVKKVKPEMPIPELEIEDYTRNAVDKANDRVAQLEAKLRERDAMDELNSRRNKLKAKGLIDTDDQIEEVEKVMLEKGITNHEAAAEYWRWMQQSAAPTPTGINKFDLSKYWRNPVAGARDEAAKALNELRKNPRPIGL
jgi:chromosome segregation ATPase